MKLTWIIACFGLTLGLAACAGDTGGDGCSSDEDCDAGFICKSNSGKCACRNDESCGAGMMCNAFGDCQVAPSCRGNNDCEEGEICFTRSATEGECIPADMCGSNLHCEFNHYCNASGQCEPGCQTTGDCQLGWVCVGGECKPGNVAGECVRCPTTPDVDSTYCEYGEVCSSSGQCVEHPAKAELCFECSTDDCGDGTTCMVDDFGGNYCAPSCRLDSDCPNGYNGCGGTILVLSTSCESGAMGPCECTTSGTCPNGTDCLGGPESTRRYCGCTSDDECDPLPAGICQSGDCVLSTCFSNSDCTQWGSGVTCESFFCVAPCANDGDCACIGGRCLAGGFPCNTGADCAISCQDSQCVTNSRVCGKEDGQTCTELTSGEAACEEL